MTTATWQSCLDRLAQHLHVQRAAIARGEVEALQVFTPEPDLGPLPVSLRERAVRLQAECSALVDQLAEASARTAEQLHAQGRPQHGAAPSYVDSHA